MIKVKNDYTEFIKDYLKSKNLKISKISIITDEDNPLPLTIVKVKNITPKKSADLTMEIIKRIYEKFNKETDVIVIPD